MKAEASFIINDALDMISATTGTDSGNSTKSDVLESPGGGNSSSPQDDNGSMHDTAPSDEEGGIPGIKTTRRKWEVRDGMVKETLSQNQIASPGGTDNSPQNPGKAVFENVKLKWDDTTAKITKKKVDELGASSWHGRPKGVNREAPKKHQSAPRRRGPRPSPQNEGAAETDTNNEPGVITIPQVFERRDSLVKEEDPTLTLGQSNGSLEIPSPFLQGQRKPAADEESIGPPPSVKNAKSRFMSESTSDFESSTTSFLAELPSIPSRRRYDDDRSVASSIVRGGRVIKVQPPTSTPMSSFLPATTSTRYSKFSSRPSTNTQRPSSSFTPASSVSNDSTDGDITEYDSIAPESEAVRLKRAESGSSHNVSVGTYDDLDMPLQPIESGSQEESESQTEDEVEFEPLKEEASPGKPTEFDVDSYEQDLEDAEIGDNDFVVDKVPRKKRWTSRNIHNFPVWPPVIKVKTWERKNVSAVSIGSGFSSIEDSFTDSNAVVSSLGDDDASYDEEEFIRRPPPRQTSYRIRYDGPTTLRLQDVYKVPPGNSDDRFEPTGTPSDGLPSMPARRTIDAAPSAPPRASTSSDRDDMSVSLDGVEEEEEKRPDVWITPMEGTQPSEAMWRVKRVWAIETEDEKEQEHDVHNHELMEKIKALVGAHEAPPPVGNPADSAPQVPQRSWHVQTVVEKRGRVENVAAERDLAEEELVEDMAEMAKEAVKEIEENKKILEEDRKRLEEKKAERAALGDVELLQDLEDADDCEPEIVNVPPEEPVEVSIPPEEPNKPEEISPALTDHVPPLSPEPGRPIDDEKDETSVGVLDSDQESVDKKDDESPVKRRGGKKPKKSKSTKTESISPKVSRKSQAMEDLKSPGTPRKSKKSSKSLSISSTPKRSSKAKVLTDGTETSPKSPRKSKSSLEAPPLTTPKRKSKPLVATAAKSKKSPKDEEKKKKVKTKKKSKDKSKAEKEKSPKRKVVSLAALVQDSSDEHHSPHSDDDKSVNSSSSEDASIPDDHSEKLAPATPVTARLSLAAMVHDSSESDLSSVDSDDSSLSGERKSLAPRIVQKTVMSPRPSGGWWKSDGKNTPSRGSRTTVAAPAGSGLKTPPLADGDKHSSKGN